MKTYTQDELKTILAQHKLWLENNLKGQCANLRGADLHCANLSGADLHYADLHYANLHYANLSGANLHYANLRGADLHCANLRGANLSGADLHCANLRGADLHCADLHCANLHYANLRGANLHYANLSGADLHCANLRGANVNIEDLKKEKWGKLLLAQQNICPTGAFIGYKKVRDDIILTLQITEKAKRLNAIGSRKCRCSEVLVLKAETIDGKEVKEKRFKSNYTDEFIYKLGKKIKEKDFDSNVLEECSTGIHFFITKQEAIEYDF